MKVTAHRRIITGLKRENHSKSNEFFHKLWFSAPSNENSAAILN